MNVKRNFLTSVLLSTLIGVGAGVAGAADYSALIKLGFFGSPATSKPDVTLKISRETRFITVAHLATVKIENSTGQSFIWQFDGPMGGWSSFLLKDFAPSGFDAGNTYVNVSHPPGHTL